MSKVKISNSELRMIIMLGAAILLALAYFFGFNRFSKAAATLEEQNEADRITVNELEAMKSRAPMVEEETKQLREDIKNIIAKYPSDLTTEKAIYHVQNLEDYSGMEAHSIEFEMGTLLMEFQPGADPSAAPPTGYYSAVTVNYAATYGDFKQMLRFVNAMPDRTTTPLVSATYDKETDMLLGTVTMNMYYLKGTDKEYEAPPLDGYSEKGVESIFGAGDGIVIPVVVEEE